MRRLRQLLIRVLGHVRYHSCFPFTQWLAKRLIMHVIVPEILRWVVKRRRRWWYQKRIDTSEWSIGRVSQDWISRRRMQLLCILREAVSCGRSGPRTIIRWAAILIVHGRKRAERSARFNRRQKVSRILRSGRVHHGHRSTSRRR